MRIIVLIKQVPDTWGERKLSESTGFVDRAASDAIIDEINERAVEVALAYKDSAKDTEVVVMTMGPASANDVLRKALAMGADSAVHITDDGLAGSDLGWTASALATAIGRDAFDLVVAGNESTDGRGGTIPAMVAEHLGVPHLSSLDSVDLSPTVISGRRAIEEGAMEVHAGLPAVISVTERSAEPRFPNFKGIMTAKKKPLEVLDISALGADASSLGESRSVIVSVAERPARTAGHKIIDEGNAGNELAEFLIAGKFI